jgi:SAM-dependent methyltransferase
VTVDLKSRVTESVKAIARPVIWRLSDASAKSRGKLLPPRRLVSRVPGDFVSVGREFVAHFRDLGHLRPDQRVLDIACGPGRIAIPLTGFLSAQGSYEGVDNWPEAVEWCHKNITPRFENFGFRVIGGDRTSEGGNALSNFPFEDATFDFAALGAISRIDETTFRAWVSEAGRVLRPGGTYMGTCFVSESADHAHSSVPASGSGDVGRTSFSEAELGDLLSSGGLNLRALYRGSWNGHPTPLSYQDIIVATKVGLQGDGH